MRTHPWTSSALFLLSSMSLSTAACGDDGGTADVADAELVEIDAEVEELPNPGFVAPEVTTRAWEEQGDSWTEIGPADWSCLGTASSDADTTVDVTVTVSAVDFAAGTAIPAATITAYDGLPSDTENISSVTTDDTGITDIVIPIGTGRVSYLVTADNQFPTYLLNQIYEPATAAQEQSIRSVSEGLAETLPALINRERLEGAGIVAGAIRDCQNREVSGAIATFSASSASPDHLEGAATHYFSAAATSLPVLHSAQAYTNSDGLFVIFDVPATEAAFIQVWGFTSDQDPATDELTLLAELEAPAIGDALISASMEPLRQ